MFADTPTVNHDSPDASVDSIGTRVTVSVAPFRNADAPACPNATLHRRSQRPCPASLPVTHTGRERARFSAPILTSTDGPHARLEKHDRNPAAGVSAHPRALLPLRR